MALAYEIKSEFEQVSEGAEGRLQAMEPPRGPPAGDFSHHQPEIEGAAMNTQPLVDLVVAAQVGPTHAAGFIRVGETAFRVLDAKSLQRLATCPSYASTIAIHGRLGLRIIFPFAAPAVGLAEVAAYGRGLQRLRRVVAVIAFVRDHFGDQRWRLQSLADRLIEHDVVQIHRGLDQTPGQRLGVPLIGAAQMDRHQGLGIQIDRMLGLMSQVGASVLHLGNAGVRIVRVLPVVVGALLGSLLVELGQILPRRRLDAFGLGQTLQILIVALTRVAPHDAA